MLDRLFSGSADLKKIVANTGWLVSGQLLRTAAGFVVGVLVARYLGPEQYGALGLAASFAALFSPLARLGLDQLVVRDIVRDPASRDALLGTAFALKAGAGVALVPVITLTAVLARPDDPRMGWLTLLAGLGTLLLAFDVIDFWFQSEVRSKYVVQARNVSYFLAAAARLAGVALGASLTFFAVVGLLELVTYAIGQVIAYQVARQSLRAWRFDGAIAGRLLREGWPLIVSGLAVMVSLRLDQAMLSVMVPGEIGLQTIGTYNVAVRFAEMWNFITSIIVISTLPAIVQAKGTSEELYTKRLQRVFDFIVIVFFSISLLITLLSNAIIRLYGESYIEAAPILAILIWSTIWAGLGGVRLIVIQAEGYFVYEMYSTILGALVNMILNLILIPYLYGLGCAIASIVSYCVNSYVSSFVFPPLRRFGIMQTKALLSPRLDLGLLGLRAGHKAH